LKHICMVFENAMKYNSFGSESKRMVS